jgi:glucan phosphoethanolaminetransferase (alkaline phosphatase superfamily)
MSNMSQNEKIKRLMPLAMLLIAFLSLIAAIIVLVSAASADASYKKVLLRISAVLFFILMALALYYFYLTRESDPNFFLFDQSTRKNIPVDQLTFSVVNERMDFTCRSFQIQTRSCGRAACWPRTTVRLDARTSTVRWLPIKCCTT